MKNKRTLASIFAAVLAGLAACGGSKSVDTSGEVAVDVGDGASAPGCEGVGCINDFAAGLDSTGELTEVEVPPGPGEAGHFCETNGDCVWGLCIFTPAGMQCTNHCVDGCPFDWVCVRPTNQRPDILYICAPPFLDLCKPCTHYHDCPTDSSEACVDYGPEGAFCGSYCKATDECPKGFECKDVVDVYGDISPQCVSKTGTCACAEWHAQMGGRTMCYVENEWGTCWGERQCGVGGLTECTASVPSPETCQEQDGGVCVCEGIR